jgi:hypothetical protein
VRKRRAEMSKNAASEELMGLLHELAATKLLEQLKGQPQFDNPEDPMEITGYYVDPRYITAAITFLNNNKVTMTPFIEEKASEIQEALAAKRTRFKVVASDAAAQAAANE